MKKSNSTGIIISGSWSTHFLLALAVFCCLAPLYAADSQRPPININLIIDGSQTFLNAKEEITSWVCNRMDQILADGDSLTIWNAGAAAKVIYTGSINSVTDREAAKKSVTDFSPSGDTADFAGALREAASRRQSSSYSYTLLISASPAALSSVLSSPQAGLLRFSRVEEFSSWRVLVVGLNLDAKVRGAAAAFYGS
jgi:hypothetical protein